MNRLSRDARALIERTRALHEPTPDDRAKVRRALALELSAAALAASVVAGSTTAAAGSAASGLQAAVIAKWLAGGIVIGALGAGAVELQTRASEPVRTVANAAAQPRNAMPARRVSAVASGAVMSATGAPPGPSAPALPASEPTRVAAPSERAFGERAHGRAVAGPADFSARRIDSAAPESTASFPIPPESSRASSTPAAPRAPDDARAHTASADELLLEARALREAHAALLDGEPERALALVRAQSRRFPKGALAEEREAAGLLALCALGRAAPAEVARFLETSSSSPLAARVRHACRER